MPNEEKKLTPASTVRSPNAQSVDFFHGVAGYLSFTPLGVVLRGVLTEEESTRALLGVRGIVALADLCQADIVNVMRGLFGETRAEELLEQLEFPLNDSKRATAIAKIPWGARDQKLNVEHYVIAGAADLRTEERRVWLETAVQEDLTGLELRRSIEAGKVVHAASTPSGRSSGGGGIVTIEGVVSFFLQWGRNNRESILAGPLATQAEFLAAVRDIATMIDAARLNLINGGYPVTHEPS